ncbi:MAG: hypothetical protein JSR77_14470 [Planctomycetes bacterium]|nr:hypothetical protein [Planctomycetota bacterium]
MIVFIGASAHRVDTKVVRRIIAGSSVGFDAFVTDEDEQTTWAMRVPCHDGQIDSAGQLKLPWTELAAATEHFHSRLCGISPGGDSAWTKTATILAVHDTGAVCSVTLDVDALRVLIAADFSRIYVAEVLESASSCGLAGPFSFAPPSFAVQVRFTLTVVSFDHHLAEINQAVGLPCHPIFCRDIDRGGRGRVATPARWRMRPVFDFEQNLETGCWSDESAEKVRCVWQRLSEAGIGSARIELSVWPELRSGQRVCAVEIPPQLRELARSIPLDIRFSFTGLRLSGG